MELAVLYSIIIFSIIIIMLYIYIIVEKLYNKIKNKIKSKYKDDIEDYLNDIVSKLDKEEITESRIEALKEYMKHKIKRELVEERMLYYFENIKGSIAKRLTALAEEIGLVEYEIRKLKNKDFHKVSLAVKNLGDIRSTKAIKSLLNLIDIEYAEVKYNVLMALAKIGDEDSFIEAFKKLPSKIPLSERSLIEIADSFEGDKVYVYRKLIYFDDDFISSIFINSAGNYKDTLLSDEIGMFLTDLSKEKKIASMKALGNMGDSRYVDKIIALLSDENWEVRAISAKVLGQLQSDKALIPLTGALSDKEWYVRYNAASSLISINGGIDMVYSILDGGDKFAKDIIVSVLETSNVWGKMQESDLLNDKVIMLGKKIKEYIEGKDR